MIRFDGIATSGLHQFASTYNVLGVFKKLYSTSKYWGDESVEDGESFVHALRYWGDVQAKQEGFLTVTGTMPPPPSRERSVNNDTGRHYCPVIHVDKLYYIFIVLFCCHVIHVDKLYYIFIVL